LFHRYGLMPSSKRTSNVIVALDTMGLPD
jgi:hypothetical protein